ncbi:MASE1 domain-containing protein [Luteibacter sp. PPL201]|uniref:MASE1 domain-containing protein n=1 Tax=Luteibacter sahnii TaxID=3021977 RepID=A0ABT6BCP2_9GAMM|nr:MASE1 domain-containing protein [Luteibacter sp. PPL193]MDY1549290.1 MASE1 domain-containing protein [Luteibacter sp. PPL193]
MTSRGEQTSRVPLGHYVAVAAAYAACYEVARHFSFSHWMLTAGLRLACLLLVPRRFWPALVVGEALPMTESALLCLQDFGAVWTVFASMPVMLLCMPVVAAIRRRMAMYDDGGRPHMSTILAATLACAIVTALRNDIGVFIVYLARPDGMTAWWNEALPDFMAYLLGSYLGALTLTPVLVAIRYSVGLRGHSVHDAIRHPLLRDTLLLAVPLVMCLVVAIGTHHKGVRELARVAMIVPVMVATARHGWTGGAVAGMLASIAMAATTTALLDPAVIRAQVILSLVISGAMVAGVRIARRAIRTP